MVSNKKCNFCLFTVNFYNRKVCGCIHKWQMESILPKGGICSVLSSSIGPSLDDGTDGLLSGLSSGTFSTGAGAASSIVSSCDKLDNVSSSASMVCTFVATGEDG